MKGLNPSYTGIWLRGGNKNRGTGEGAQNVLTLLILEFGFGANNMTTQVYEIKIVLTLLILEFGFGEGNH